MTQVDNSKQLAHHIIHFKFKTHAEDNEHSLVSMNLVTSNIFTSVTIWLDIANFLVSQGQKHSMTL
jgi:hypothetical protein